MAKKNRTSVLKRQREAEKRQRQAKRAAKAALKRERRMNKGQVPADDQDGTAGAEETSGDVGGSTLGSEGDDSGATGSGG